MTTALDASVLETPVGPLSLVVDGETLAAAGFVADPAALHARMGAARRARPLHVVPDLGVLAKPVVAYFDGDLAAIDDIAVDQDGTAGQRAVWEALRTIPAGETRSYSSLATTIGRPRAVRAVGSACGRNLVAPVVPCHRAVRTGGGLGGYYYGLPVKEWLLAHERRHAGRR
jgi:methylated-DNA-[protein]-cysteine S-methyltransferase